LDKISAKGIAKADFRSVRVTLIQGNFKDNSPGEAKFRKAN